MFFVVISAVLYPRQVLKKEELSFPFVKDEKKY
jgi:hypothetical protein